MSRLTIVLAAILAAVVGCGSGRPQAAPASSAHRQVRASTGPPPSWCTPAFAAAANGHTPTALEPYLKDSPVINDLFKQWAFVLAENNMISQPKSITWLWNNAPVTTGGLQSADEDISKLNKICQG